ncbi:unnamed protein product [Ophioblennius macclurei]
MLAEEEAELQTLLKQLLRSVQDRMSSAPSVECAEEILLHLEETDKNFHNYNFVKFLRQHVEKSLGSLVEEETKNFARGEAQHAAIGPGHDALVHAVTRRTKDSAEYQWMMQTLKTSMVTVVESLVNKFEEDQLRKEKLRHQSNTDNCSDSDSSFNQSYAFIRQEQLQVLVEKLDVSKPKQVRWEALHALCCAPPSDVLSCESWRSLRCNLSVALSEADSELGDLVLQFFSRSFSSCPLNVTQEIYTSLGQSVESSFSCQAPTFPSGSSILDVEAPLIARLLKQIRLMNDFQKEVTTFWIRYPEKYMEEVVEATFSMLTLHQDQGSSRPERLLEPVHLLALLDVKATWFNKWMHGYYSRTVVLRLLQRKYRSLVVGALQQCVRYSEACGCFPEDEAAATPLQRHGSAQRSTYSGRELEYAYFVHSLCILGKTLIYANGRKLFPVKMRKHKEPLGLTELVIILIKILYRCPKTRPSDASHTDILSPSSLVMELLWMLCERDECAAECLHQDIVMETLLEPLMGLLQGQQIRLNSPAATLTLVADILARVANTDGGLSLFLYKKNVVWNHGERTSAAHVIVHFTLRLLGKDPPLREGMELHRSAMCGAFIFVCRQMYNTCEGLQVLLPYGLHRAASAAWRQTISLSERVPTPVPGASAGGSTHDSQSMLVWEETLLDSLLNFAATPKGFLLLQQTGATAECVCYMFSRFTRKLQVSRCEKFGYGVMVTQVAATAPGVQALHASGLIRALVVELWSVLECGGDDVRVVRPKPTPMEPIDRSCLKSFVSLVNILSSSRSLFELLARQSLANRREYPLREVPTSVPDLIDRLVALNSDVKIQSLFHYEQSHTFGLRLLSVLCCSLDSFLLLESQYNISSMLLQGQRENRVDRDNNQGDVMIDSLSVERNHVLVRVGVVGGPSERRLPPRALQEGECPYPWPMFCSYPLPACYTLDCREPQHSSRDSEIGAFLSSPEENEENWTDACRNHFCRAVTSNPNTLTGEVLADLLEEAVARLSRSTAECFFSPARYKVEERSVKNITLSSVEQLGVLTCLRYGRNLKLLREEDAHELTALMKHVKTFLSNQRVRMSSQLITLQDSYPGHDWLVSTVFLVMGGDSKRSLSLLLNLSTLLTSAFVWPARIHASVHLPREVCESGIPPVYWCSAHYVEMLLKAEVPLVHSAFRMSGFTPSQMCLHWLTQCFWNHLDWTEICLYLLTCVLMGPDYQVYMCVSVLRHLEPDILQHTQNQELQVFLKEEPIRGFRLGDHMDFMVGLEQRYRSVVLANMRTILDPVP